MFLTKNTGKTWFLVGFEPTNQHVINTSQQRKKLIVHYLNQLLSQYCDHGHKILNFCHICDHGHQSINFKKMNFFLF